MLIVQETAPDVFVEIPPGMSFTSSDGIHHSPQLVDLWSAADLAAIGVYLVEPATIPSGKQATAIAFERNGEGDVVQVLTLEDIPPPPSASKLGIKRALAELDQWETVRSAIASDPDVQEEWDLAVEIYRSDPLTQQIINLLSLTPAEVDALIIRAHQLVNP